MKFSDRFALEEIVVVAGSAATKNSLYATSLQNIQSEMLTNYTSFGFAQTLRDAVSRCAADRLRGNLRSRKDLAERVFAYSQAVPVRRDGPCKGQPMPNGRCRMHGGPSTGPRTPEGLERLRKARTKHGSYSADMKLMRALIRSLKCD
jgi:hypothetical protein